MRNISHIIQAEIAAQTHKKIQSAVRPLQAQISQMQRVLDELARHNKGLQQKLKSLNTASLRRSGASAAPKVIYTTMGIKTLRRRLGISQASLAILIGISEQAVYQWERRQRNLRLRMTTRDAIDQLVSMDKRQVQELLAQRKAALAIH